MHDAGIQFTNRQRRRGNQCTAIAKPVYQSPNYCATARKIECRISLGILPVRNEGPKGCVETNTGSFRRAGDWKVLELTKVLGDRG